MMMRSTPPASADLAEMPVPAPAPMTGFPAAMVARRRPSAVARSISALHAVIAARADKGVQLVGHPPSQDRVVDVRVVVDHRHAAAVDARRDGIEERLVGLRVVERLARR